MKGVLTADVIGSTKMNLQQRNALPETLDKLADELQKICPIRLEMYRGDSFQVLVEDYKKAPLIAVLLRLGLMQKSQSDEKKIDARISIGIGGVSYMADTLGKSDGEAFVLSGRAFERIEKKSLLVVTSNEAINAEMDVYDAILDELLRDISVARSKTVYAHLLRPELKQDKIGELVGVTKQAVGQSYKASKVNIIDLVLKRMEAVLVKY